MTMYSGNIVQSRQGLAKICDHTFFQPADEVVERRKNKQYLAQGSEAKHVRLELAEHNSDAHNK